MACGAPVVLSDLSSLHEWVAHENEGLFVPAGDIRAISQAIIRLLQDDDLRRRMGQNAREKIRQQADRVRWGRRAEELYHELASWQKIQT